MRKFISNNLYLFFFSLTVIYIGISFNKSNIDNQLLGDFPGHLYQSASLFTNVDSAIYSFQYFMGFYPALYPPLTSYIRDIALNFMSVKTYIVLFYSINYYMFLVFMNRIFGKGKRINLFFILAFLYFLLAPRAWLIVVHNLSIGSMPGFLGINLLIIYIYYYLHIKRDNYNSSITLGLAGGLIILTHAITASVYFVLYTTSFFLKLYKYKQKRISFMQLKIDLFSGLISFLIGIPWIYCLLSLQNQIPKLGVEGYASIELILFLGVIVFLFLTLKKYNLYKLDDNDITLFITALILLVFGTISKFLSVQIATGLHLYRYYPYSIYIFLILLGRIYQKIIGVSQIKYQFFAILFIVYISFSLIGYYNFNFKVNLNITDRLDLSNTRILDISENLAFADAAYYVSTQLVTKQNAVDTYGLFAQDAPMYVFTSIIRNKLVPKINLNLFGVDLKQSDLFNEIEDINEKLDLFGVQYLVVEKNTLKDNKDFVIETKLLSEIGQYEINKYKGKLYLYDTKFDYGVVAPLSYLPKYEPDASIVKRWEGLNTNNLYTKDKRVEDIKFEQVKLKSNIIKDLKVSNNRVSFNVDSDKDLPILVKFADSPILKIENNGTFVDKYNVASGLFFVYGKGQFDIYPQAPKMLHLLVNLSKLLILLMSIYLIYIRLFMNRKVTG